jgi:hypothetical protein
VRVGCTLSGIFGDEERAGRVSSDGLMKDFGLDTKPKEFRNVSGLEADHRLIELLAATRAQQVLLQES